VLFSVTTQQLGAAPLVTVRTTAISYRRCSSELIRCGQPVFFGKMVENVLVRWGSAHEMHDGGKLRSLSRKPRFKRVRMRCMAASDTLEKPRPESRQAPGAVKRYSFTFVPSYGKKDLRHSALLAANLMHTSAAVPQALHASNLLASGLKRCSLLSSSFHCRLCLCSRWL
jgi:hypothetical protein